MLSETETIILIGPPCAGKTTVANLVGKELKKKSVSLDTVEKNYYEECGFYKSNFSYDEDNFGYLYAYKVWEQYRVHAVKRILEDYPGYVMDFGAGHTHYINKYYLTKVQSLLLPYSNIFLLLPTSRREKAIKILRKRNLEFRNKNWIYENYDFIYHWIDDEDNYQLSKEIIFTEEKSFQMISNEIISKAKLSY